MGESVELHFLILWAENSIVGFVPGKCGYETRCGLREIERVKVFEEGLVWAPSFGRMLRGQGGG